MLYELKRQSSARSFYQVSRLQNQQAQADRSCTVSSSPEGRTAQLGRAVPAAGWGTGGARAPRRGSGTKFFQQTFTIM